MQQYSSSDHTMKKTFYYNIFLTKEEEEAAAKSGLPYEGSRTLVEIRDLASPAPPQIDPGNPWRIRKSVSTSEVVNGRLLLSHNEIFEHVFRYWSKEMCNHVLCGAKSYVIIFDYTENEEVPKRFQGEKIFLKGEYNDTYTLGWTDVVRSRVVNPGDEIGLFWDVRSATFGFKLLRGAANNPRN